MSLEFNLIEFIKDLKKVMSKAPVHKDEERYNETVYLDFAVWENCTFEKCRIVIEYGLLSANGCSFNSCYFEWVEGRPAYIVLQLYNMIKADSERGNEDLEEWK